MKTGQPHILPKFIIYGFFVLGILSAVAFRTIIVFQRLEPSWVRPLWYAGVMGYLVFFLYRYYISKKRKTAIKDYDLIRKLESGEALSREERKVVTYLLSSIQKSPEDINYYIIFALSILAILVDVAFEMF